MSHAAQTQQTDKATEKKAKRITERRRFVGGDRARMTVVLRQRRSDFLTYVEHREAGADKPVKRGMFLQHQQAAKAMEAFEAAAKEALEHGWRPKSGPRDLPTSEFGQLPKAAAPVGKKKAARK